MGTQEEGESPPLEDVTKGDWESREKLTASCNELQGVYISGSATVTCSYNLQVFNKPNYQFKSWCIANS